MQKIADTFEITPVAIALCCHTSFEQLFFFIQAFGHALLQPES